MAACCCSAKHILRIFCPWGLVKDILLFLLLFSENLPKVTPKSVRLLPDLLGVDEQPTSPNICHFQVLLSE